MQIEWYKVTWYSKLISAILFGAVFLIGIKIGQQYQETKETQNFLWVTTPQRELPADNDTSIGKVQTFTSEKLGISFQYAEQNFGHDIVVKEVGDKVYVYSPPQQTIQQGQSVQEFSKDPKDNLTTAISKNFLAGISAKECSVELSSPESYQYPASYVVAQITYPKTPDLVPGQISAKCPQAYSQTNGIRFFVMDRQIPDKFFFFDIGQYAFWTDFQKRLACQATFQVTQ